MNVLVLDDMQERLDWFKRQLVGHNTVLCKNGSSAANYLCNKAGSKAAWDVAFLDHDLGGAPYVHKGPDGFSGMTVVERMIELDVFPSLIVVHSLNEDCRDEMVAKLVDAGANALSIPYITLMKTGIKLQEMEIQ